MHVWLESIINGDKWINLLTVLGLGSKILCINVFAPAENQTGQTNSAALIYKYKWQKEKSTAKSRAKVNSWLLTSRMLLKWTFKTLGKGTS